MLRLKSQAASCASCGINTTHRNWPAQKARSFPVRGPNSELRLHRDQHHPNRWKAKYRESDALANREMRHCLGCRRCERIERLAGLAKFLSLADELPTPRDRTAFRR